MWSHSSSSGWLIGPRSACAIFQSAWGDGWSRETSTPCLATPNLCSSFLQRKGWGESSGNHLLFLVYFIPTLDQDHNLPRVLLPFHLHLHKCILLSLFWLSLKLFCHHHLFCAYQFKFLLKTTVLRWLPVLLCCYSNRSEEAAYDGDPAGTLAFSLVLSLSILLESELMSSRDGGEPSTGQCTNCCAGQSG